MLSTQQLIIQILDFNPVLATPTSEVVEAISNIIERENISLVRIILNSVFFIFVIIVIPIFIGIRTGISRRS